MSDQDEMSPRSVTYGGLLTSYELGSDVLMETAPGCQVKWLKDGYITITGPNGEFGNFFCGLGVPQPSAADVATAQMREWYGPDWQPPEVKP